MRGYLKILVSVSLSTVFFTSCYYDNKEELYQNLNQQPIECDSNLTVSYSADISPVLTSNCALSGCHTGASPVQGLNLGNYNDVRRVALDNRLVHVITGGPPQMPPGGSLSAMEIDLIQTWVDEGACNN